ncbi:hypothetical protein [Agrobacterium sp. CG674]
MQLVTVRFTTKNVVSQFDAHGVKTGEYETEIQQCITGIPKSTADGYRKFGNWSIEPYHVDPDLKLGGRGIKKGDVKIVMSSRRAGKSFVSKVTAAAATGDLAAALNT